MLSSPFFRSIFYVDIYWSSLYSSFIEVVDTESEECIDWQRGCCLKVYSTLPCFLVPMPMLGLVLNNQTTMTWTLLLCFLLIFPFCMLLCANVLVEYVVLYALRAAHLNRFKSSLQNFTNIDTIQIHIHVFTTMFYMIKWTLRWKNTTDLKPPTTPPNFQSNLHLFLIFSLQRSSFYKILWTKEASLNWI